VCASRRDVLRRRGKASRHTDSAAIFVRLAYVVGANRDEPAISNLELTMEFNKPSAALGAEPSAAENENHWILSLQFGEPSAFRGVIEKPTLGENST
jgi:hypothetical protein